MYILPITLFCLCPVLKLQRHHEWGTICATDGRRRRWHNCRVWALAWPYQLHQLQLLHPKFKALADKRLTERSNLNSGCGGIAILSCKTLLAIPLDVQSDRIGAIQLKHSSSSSIMTTIGAYLPSTDHQTEEFESYLQQLEYTIIANNQLGPVMVAGNFNAHIGC